jgi:hypothetical protein
MGRLSIVVLATMLVIGSALAGPKDPIVGQAFDRVVDAQDRDLQQFLESVFPESAGYVVAGPLDPLYAGDPEFEALFHTTRIICATLDVFDAAESLAESRIAPARARGALQKTNKNGFEHVGRVIEFPWQEHQRSALVMTYQQVRWLIWLRGVERSRANEERREPFEKYSVAISQALHRCDGEGYGWPDDTSLTAKYYGLSSEYEFYPPRPEYVIQGYQNYRDYIHRHSDIETFFADGILAFVPSDSLLDVLKGDAANIAWPNKEAPLLQHEFKKFFDRGGDVGTMMTLTVEVLAKLKPGEYFYAVGVNGSIRFAYEIPREEVERVEKESGKKVPRANHAFLFPGEPVLTAGAFFVVTDPDPRIVEVNTHSGHYFYSNITETIRRDVAVRSDEYLLTIGHFFTALDRAGIPYRDVLIRKM